MNRTNLEHAVYALIIQAVIGLLTNNWGAGAAFASAFFIGREHAQREFEISKPHLLKGYEAFDVWRWSTDAKLDALFPIIATTVLALMVTL